MSYRNNRDDALSRYLFYKSAQAAGPRHTLRIYLGTWLLMAVVLAALAYFTGQWPTVCAIARDMYHSMHKE